jgi:hypothetical protein
LTIFENWENLNSLVEENQRNVYPLSKRWEIKSETTITIYSKNSFDLQWFSHTI